LPLGDLSLLDIAADGSRVHPPTLIQVFTTATVRSEVTESACLINAPMMTLPGIGVTDQQLEARIDGHEHTPRDCDDA
jgi:hypothetical protein